MRSLFFIIFFSIAIVSKSQILLTPQLVDSVIRHMVSNKTIDKRFPLLEIIKFSQNPKNPKQLIASQTFVTIRMDIPNSSFLYLRNGYIVLLSFENVMLHPAMINYLIKSSEPKYTAVLDSLKFEDFNTTGVLRMRYMIDVVKIKKCRFTKNCYNFKFEKIFPVDKAPKEILPIEHPIDNAYISYPVTKFMYNYNGELLDEYKQMLIVKKPVKICLRK